MQYCKTCEKEIDEQCDSPYVQDLGPYQDPNWIHLLEVIGAWGPQGTSYIMTNGVNLPNILPLNMMSNGTRGQSNLKMNTCT